MKRLRNFPKSFGSLLLVFLLLLPSSCWADVVLTDQEYQILDQKLEKAEKLQKSSEEKISSLESDLTKAKESQENSEKKIQHLETRLVTAETSYAKQKKDQKIKLIKYTIVSFIIGAVTGTIGDKIIK